MSNTEIFFKGKIPVFNKIRNKHWVIEHLKTALRELQDGEAIEAKQVSYKVTSSTAQRMGRELNCKFVLRSSGEGSIFIWKNPPQEEE